MRRDYLRSLALAGLPEQHLLRRLGSELAHMIEERGEPAMGASDVRALLRVAFAGRRIQRQLVDALLAEAKRQVEVRSQRKWDRLDVELACAFNYELAKDALRQVRRARDKGKRVEVDKVNRVYRIASGRGWKVVPWKLPL